MRTRRALIAFSAMLPGLIGRAEAQAISSPEDVRACLCLEQAVPTLGGAVETQRQAYDERRQTLDALNKQVEDGRAQVNVNNPADVDAFKQLLQRRDDAAAEFSALTNDYSGTVERYNHAVTDYNNKCAGRIFDPRTFSSQGIDEIKRTLSCPKP